MTRKRSIDRHNLICYNMFKSKMPKQITIQAVVDRRLKDLIIRLAKRARRSESEYVRLVLEDHVNENLSLLGPESPSDENVFVPPLREPRHMRRAGQKPK